MLTEREKLIHNKILEICKKENISLMDIVRHCEHDEVVNTHDSSKCLGCGEYLGWWCPDSPTHTCEYEDAFGNYDEDDCIYCHGPLERK